MEPIPGGQLADITTALADPLFQIVARLAKGPRDAQDKPMALATMEEADFPGYVPVVVTGDAVNQWEQEGYAEMGPQVIRFEAGNGITAQFITHLYYTKTYNGAEPSIVGGTAFDAPILIDRPGQVMEFDCTVAGVVSQ